MVSTHNSAPRWATHITMVLSVLRNMIGSMTPGVQLMTPSGRGLVMAPCTRSKMYSNAFAPAAADAAVMWIFWRHAQRVLVPGAVIGEKMLVMLASDMGAISSPNAAGSTFSTGGVLWRPTCSGDEARKAASSSESLPSNWLGKE